MYGAGLQYVRQAFPTAAAAKTNVPKPLPDDKADAALARKRGSRPWWWPVVARVGPW